VVTAWWHPRHRAGRRSVAGNRWWRRRARATGGWDRADSRGLVVRGTRERQPVREGVNQMGKHTFANAPSTLGIAGPAGLDSARERSEASEGRVGRKVSRAENKEKEFQN
jgi:hypothetical protein